MHFSGMFPSRRKSKTISTSPWRKVPLHFSPLFDSSILGFLLSIDIDATPSRNLDSARKVPPGVK